MQIDRTMKLVVPLTLFCAIYGMLASRSILLASPRFGGLTLIPTLFICLIFCRLHERATPYTLSLPIPARQIFLARMLVILTALWFPAIMTSLACMTVDLSNSTAATNLLGAAALATLMVVILSSIRMQEMGIPTIYVYIFFSVLLALFWLVQRWQFAMAPVLTVCLVTSALVFSFIWRRIPGSFQIAPPEAYAEESIRIQTKNRKWPPATYRLIHRSTSPMPMFFLMGLMILSRGILFFPLIVIFVPLVWVHFRRHISWLWAFPIARGAVLLFAVLSILVSMEVGHVRDTYTHGFAENMWIVSTQDWRHGANRHRYDGMRNILPPLAFWKPVHSDKAPLIEAPWGETFQPPTSDAFGFRIYNPYAVGKDNSQRFFDWQFAIATAAAYGRALPKSEITAYWISPWSHNLFPPINYQIAYASLSIGLVLLILACIELFHLRCFQAHQKFIRIAGISILISICAALVLFLMMSTDVVGYSNSLPLIISWSLPESLPAAIVIVLASLGLMYWILDILFRKAEYDDKPN
jgi:hypothetical protein